MEAPCLQSDNFIYTRLKGLVWAANGTTLPNLFQSAAGKMLSNLIEEYEPEKPLLINCKGIVQFDDHALESVKQSLQGRGRTLILAHASQIEVQLRQALGEPASMSPLNGGADIMIVGTGLVQPSYAEEMLNEVTNLEQEYAKLWVADCFHRFGRQMERMSSTPLLASGVFDARNIISDPQQFFWISLMMADRLEQYLDESLEDTNMVNSIEQSFDAASDNKMGSRGTSPKGKAKTFRLLAVSLRGSPFAAAVGLLTGRQKSIEIVDHMGPKYNIMEEHSFGPAIPDSDYILVGDFIVGGTELRIAQTYARSKGCILKHAIVIGCLLKPHEYQSGIGISNIVKLRECCPTALFRFVE